MEFEKDIVRCLEVLHGGGLILYPTDTVWGIGCDATNPKAVDKIISLKHRLASKSMIVLVAEVRDINRYSSRVEPFVAQYLETTTTPTTVIYEGALGLAENLVGDDGSVAIRVVQEPFCRHLIKRFRKPLVSTSANLSGQETPKNFAAVSKEIIAGVDYTVKYRQEDLTEAKPSRLLRFTKNGEPEILRS